MNKQFMNANDINNISQKKSGRRKLLIVLFICAFPMIASYISYYFIKPSGRVNYGKLIEPQREMPSLLLTQGDGTVFDVNTLKGKWLMITVGAAKCDQICDDQLINLRQIRLAQGKDSERIIRLRLITDKEKLDPDLLKKYTGTLFLKAELKQVADWLSEGQAESNDEMSSHIFLVDPLGNLMMRFPTQPDPNKIKKDITRLLKVSSVG